MDEKVTSTSNNLYFENDCNMSFGQRIYKSLESKGNCLSMIDYVSGRKLTYKEMSKLCGNIYLEYKENGISVDDKILLILENTIEYYSFMIASIYIGAIICPVNPHLTEYEMAHVFKLIQPKLCIAGTASLNVAESVNKTYKIKILNSDVLLEKLYEKGTPNLIPEVFDHQKECVILLSSGTTGFSKGAVFTQEALINFIPVLQRPDFMNMNNRDVVLGILPFYHIMGLDLALNNIFTGIKLVVQQKFKPHDFLDAISKYKVTKLVIVPTIASFLANAPIVSDYDLKSLVKIFCAASPLYEDLKLMLENRLKVGVNQGYGMTEINYVLHTPFNNSINKPGTCGVLLPNVKVKVLDVNTKKLLSSNQPGELYFKTNASFKRYLGDSLSTKQAFDEENYIRTGDFGYFDEDGYFYIRDRLKELIKCKGFQVAPAEIEEVLLKHASVKDAAVIGIPDEKLGEAPFAFVVKESGTELSEEELHKFIENYLVHYKRLIGGIKFIEEIPKNSTGKILRRKLIDISKSDGMLNQNSSKNIK